MQQETQKSETSSDSVSSDANVCLSATFISYLLEQHRAAKIQAVVSGQGQRITDLESNAEAVCGRLEQLEATCSSLQEDNKSLKSKLSHFEGRNLRHNICIMGLPESAASSISEITDPLSSSLRSCASLQRGERMWLRSVSEASNYIFTLGVRP